MPEEESMVPTPDVPMLPTLDVPIIPTPEVPMLPMPDVAPVLEPMPDALDAGGLRRLGCEGVMLGGAPSEGAEPGALLGGTDSVGMVGTTIELDTPGRTTAGWQFPGFARAAGLTLVADDVWAGDG
jgi:hypothetical protein